MASLHVLLVLSCLFLSAQGANGANLRPESTPDQEALGDSLSDAYDSEPNVEMFDPSLLKGILEYEMGEDDDEDYLSDELADVDDQILLDAEEYLFDENGNFNGCLCDCMEGDDGYAPDTVRMFQMNEEQDESTPICVSDIASVEFNTEGLAICDEQCYLDGVDFDDDQQEEDEEEDN